ncbi:MAG TPA: hypothetical protein VEG84_02170 [Thermoanaerobaculia bacterium]|nr:hypothetical protein [Thermoanaerobaculia bacterium]
MTTAARAPLAALCRALAGFLLAIGFWYLMRAPYDRLLANAGELLLRAVESPPVTRLTARGGEILVARADFPPAAPQPGLPAADLHFNVAILAALFALDRHPLDASRVAALLAAGILLFLVHVVALAFDVRSLYATGLGPWSAARYSPLARNFWAGGFHFYEVAGRFAAPFAIWWPFRREPEEPSGGGGRPRKRAA